MSLIYDYLVEFFKQIFSKLRKKKKEVVVNIKIETPGGGEEVRLPTQSEPPAIVLPTNSIPTVHYFLNNNKPAVYKFLLNQIRKAVSQGKPYVSLFKIGNTPLFVRIEQKDYEKSILDMQKFFIATEQFELAEVCKKLLDKNRVNQIIESSKGGNG